MRIPATINHFAKVFQKNKYQIFLVGGAVRDYLIGKKNIDYDFTTDATPQEVIKLFPNVVPVGIAHGTVIVLYEGSEFEVTTFRSDGKYSDNRHPDNVNFVKTIEEDLKRRDFTINALAYDIIKKKMIDLYNGKNDLKNKLIRAIGLPKERFSEDALRILRACRFASKLNFIIEDNTLNAMKELSLNITSMSTERIRDELIKIMNTEKPSIALEYMRISGLLEYILPELAECYGVIQNRFHKHDVYYHNLYTCDAAPINHVLRFAGLYHDIAKPITRREKDDTDNENSFYNHEIIGSRIAYKRFKSLKFSNEDLRRISHLIKYHMFYYTNDWTDGAVRRFIRNVGVENLEDLFILREADRIGNGTKQGIPEVFINFKDRIKKILEIDNAFKVSDLDIDGEVIMKEIELKPGPIIGEILNFLLEQVLDDPNKNNKKALIKEAKEYYDKKKEYAINMYNEKPENLGRF